MKLQLYRECGPRSNYTAFFEVTEKNALELVTTLAREGLRVHLSPSDYEETLGERVGPFDEYLVSCVAKTVPEVVKKLKPRGR